MRHLLAVFLKIPEEHTRYFYMGVLPWNQCRIFLSGSHATLLARCRDKIKQAACPTEGDVEDQPTKINLYQSK